MNNQLPLASVHMITYNQELYIAQAIESVINQKTNFNFELVIGEDCSTDKTRAIVLDFQTRYPEIIHVVYSETNVGIIENTQRVTNACKGKYIAYCEGDDFWHNPAKLQKQISFLENNSDYGLVHGDYNAFYERTNQTIEAYNKTHNIKIAEGYIYDDLLDPGNYLIKTPTACFRKEFLTEYFSYTVMKERKWKLDDLPLWLAISHRSKIKYIPESLATYRILKESNSNTQDPFKRYDFHKMVYDIRYYYIEKYGCSEQIEKVLDINYHKTMMIDAYSTKNKELADKSLQYFKINNVKLTFKEYLFYAGTRYIILRNVIEIFRRLLK